MATKLDKLEERLAKLKRDADALNARQRADMVKRARDTVATFELTVEDLFGKADGSGRQKVRPPKKAALPARKSQA